MDACTLTGVKSDRRISEPSILARWPAGGFLLTATVEGTTMKAVAITSLATDQVVKPVLSPWSKRVRWVGGLIQAAFAAFWLLRGSAVIGGTAESVLLAVFAILAIGVFGYAVRFASGAAPRPRTSDDKRIERQVTVATLIEFAAAIILPVLVIATGHPDWVLPSIAITIGPLLLWLDHRVSVPRYRAIGWVLSIGPLILVATMSGTALVATTGITAGMVLLGTAMAGFRELAAFRHTEQGFLSSNIVVSPEVQL